MARKVARAALVLTDEQRSMLKELAGSRTAAQREVERAKVLLAYADMARRPPGSSVCWAYRA